MDNTSQAAIQEEKRKRLYDNFISDLGILKEYFEDKTITDIKVVGSGEIIIEKFAVGKVFTEKYLYNYHINS